MSRIRDENEWWRTWLVGRFALRRIETNDVQSAIIQLWQRVDWPRLLRRRFRGTGAKKKKMELIDWIVSQTLETGSFVYLKLDRFLFPNVVAWRSEKPVREEKQLVENSADCCSRIGWCNESEPLGIFFSFFSSSEDLLSLYNSNNNNNNIELICRLEILFSVKLRSDLNFLLHEINSFYRHFFLYTCTMQFKDR